MTKQTGKPISLLLGEIASELFANCNEKESRYVSRYGISLGEAKCLRKMNGFDSLTVNQLAHELNLTSSRITRITDSLVAKGYVLRETDSHDRRVYNLTLTEKGKKLAGDLIDGYKKIHSEILRNVPQEYHAIMIEALKVLNLAVVEWLEKH
ncbi:MAG: MarR family transcriptional regulator [Calditrichaeota bacterium]|nr:MarR family transcriptional regulator [Calditrichota bacterium]